MHLPSANYGVQDVGELEGKLVISKFEAFNFSTASLCVLFSLGGKF